MPPSTASRRPGGHAGSVVLGIDPGTLVTGYGLIAGDASSRRHLASGMISNQAGSPIAERLQAIYDGLVKIIATYHPTEVAIETAFYGKNARSALILGQARGVSILAAIHHRLPLSEYAPREVKKAVVGNGNASKQQVQFMVKTLLRLQDSVMAHDTSDALAVALCHLERSPRGTAQLRTWKSYIEAHPERVRQ